MSQRNDGRVGEVVSLGSMLDGLIDGVEARVQARNARLQALWEQVCGARLARQSRVVGVEDDLLLVEVEDDLRQVLFEARLELSAGLRRRSTLRGLRLVEPR
ncbi:DUF721 domain-containing protein [Myxococcota bacterium]|nr:DUF721 domain-containing protein [Myxococcota bacterium]MBU1431783.1 DUF721 domain-containing protein [Myxococcota bacterium]MBU1898482.1 DUF721 domain-containing protein [Myxococcota bacterium]